MNVLEEIFNPYKMYGHSCLIITGRPIYDLDLSGVDGHIDPLVTLLIDYVKNNLHMVVVRYSIVSHGAWVPYEKYDKADVETIKKALSDNGINTGSCASGNCKASQDFAETLIGICRLASTDTKYNWKDGNRMNFLFLFEFTSDNMPDVNIPSNAQAAARQAVIGIISGKQFRNSHNMVLLTDTVEGKIDSQIQSLAHRIFLPYPNKEDKLAFIDRLHKEFPKAKYASGLDDEFVANLTSNTPNNDLYNYFGASHENGGLIELKALVEQKSQNIQSMSEGTITVLDTNNRVSNLVGTSIGRPREILDEQARALKTGSGLMVTNILLAGAPGTGKTCLATAVAKKYNLPAFEMHSAKAGIVGETERRASLQARIFSSIKPAIGFIDEISEGLPMQRSHNLDSGASDAVMQAWLTTLSDNRRAGNSLLIATTNCIQKLGAAMRDRFLIIPTIMPAEADMASIICAIVMDITKNEIDPNNAVIQEAAREFYRKHIMPRRIRSILVLACQQGVLSPESILDASKDAVALDYPGWASAVYADLSAISATVSKRLLPWYGREDSYNFPGYIREILDSNLEIDTEKLNKKLQSLEPNVNV